MCTEGLRATRDQKADKMLYSLPDSRLNGDHTFVGSSLWPLRHRL